MGGRRPQGSIEQALAEQSPTLYSRYCQLCETALSDITPWQQDVRDTRAGAEHCGTVHLLLSRLTPDEKIAKYKPIEIFCLLGATWLHDIGKIREHRGIAVRHHAVESAEAVVTEAENLGLSDAEAMTVAHIIKGHGPDPIGNLPDIRGVSPYGTIRVRYFAALLRLADDLDAAFTRAPKLTRRLVEPDGGKKWKWDLRESIDNVEISPETWTIEIQATPRTENQLSAVLSQIEVINARLAESRPYLRATTDIGLYYSLIDHRLDDFWLHKEAASGSAGDSQNEVHVDADSESGTEMPRNAVAVIIRHDPTAVGAYNNVVGPTLRDMGYSPVLIEDFVPEDTLLGRTVSVLKNSEVILADLSGGGAPSVHFRLGVAAGLGKKMLVYSRGRAPAVGDLGTVETVVFETDEDLKESLRGAISRIQVRDP